jgi:hypothetical protein
MSLFVVFLKILPEVICHLYSGFCCMDSHVIHPRQFLKCPFTRISFLLQQEPCNILPRPLYHYINLVFSPCIPFCNLCLWRLKRKTTENESTWFLGFWCLITSYCVDLYLHKYWNYTKVMFRKHFLPQVQYLQKKYSNKTESCFIPLSLLYFVSALVNLLLSNYHLYFKPTNFVAPEP